MFLAVLSGFIFAVPALFLHRVGNERAGWLVSLVPLGLTAYFASFIGPVAAGRTIYYFAEWVPGLGVSLSFQLDGLSLLFALLITGIGTLVFIYSGTYLAAHRHLGRFFAYLLIFMASMLGVVLADNVYLLFVFWELTSLSSYLLIGFEHEREAARHAALQALLVTGCGGLAMLVGLLLMARVGASSEISFLLGRGELVRAHSLYLPILLLILAGAFTKSAQAPFHFWLPNAMEAPAPVSTYLHSATMVKAGIYLLARLSPVLGGTVAWEYLLTAAGSLTMLTGAYLALVHTDLKRILAYTTVSALGLLTLLLGIGQTLAIQATMVFLLSHALYKAALFLIAGAVDHETGTRDLERLGGLFRFMPFTAAAAVLAALSSAGIPPLLGFIGKELIYEAAFNEPAAHLLIGAVLLTNISFVAVAGNVGIRPFFGKMLPLPKTPHRPPLALRLGPLLLAALGLFIGLAPGLIESVLVAPSVAAVERRTVAVELALWHGFHPRLALSAIAFALGIWVYLGWSTIRCGALRLDPSARLGPARCYDLLIDGMKAFARFQTRLLQSGHLHFYLLIIIVTTVGFVGAPLLQHTIRLDLWRWSQARAYEIIPAALILAATVQVVRSRSLISAVVSLGVVGYGVALLFLLFSAPDLAMTQFAIETLSVVLLVLVLLRLPDYRTYSKTAERLRDAVPALAAGAIMTVLVLAATAVPREGRLTPFFAERSWIEAQGRNVVNVILVDFRGLDTLGEITVLVVAAIGVYSLLKLYLKDDRKRGGGG